MYPKKHWKSGGLLCLMLLLAPFTVAMGETNPQVKAAVSALLQDAKAQFDAQKFEQSAAILERALRIDPGNPILWHNLAGVRLEQKSWQRALSLAARSNNLVMAAGKNQAFDRRWLRIRNWTVIALACESLEDLSCAREARKRAYNLATQD